MILWLIVISINFDKRSCSDSCIKLIISKELDRLRTAILYGIEEGSNLFADLKTN